jgi:hypothetical protein
MASFGDRAFFESFFLFQRPVWAVELLFQKSSNAWMIVTFDAANDIYRLNQSETMARGRFLWVFEEYPLGSAGMQEIVVNPVSLLCVLSLSYLPAAMGTLHRLFLFILD